MSPNNPYRLKIRTEQDYTFLSLYREKDLIAWRGVCKNEPHKLNEIMDNYFAGMRKAYEIFEVGNEVKFIEEIERKYRNMMNGPD